MVKHVQILVSIFGVHCGSSLSWKHFVLCTKMLQVVPKTEHTEMLQYHSRLVTVLKTVAMVH